MVLKKRSTISVGAGSSHGGMSSDLTATSQQGERDRENKERRQDFVAQPARGCGRVAVAHDFSAARALRVQCMNSALSCMSSERGRGSPGDRMVLIRPGCGDITTTRSAR